MWACLFVLAALGGCFSALTRVEVTALGRAHPSQTDAKNPDAARKLDYARERLAAKPDDVERIVWVGRRLGYLRRMREAIDVLSDGLRKFPNHAELLRHRGHRRISLRQFRAAIADLSLAAETMGPASQRIEQDGLPNAANIPLTTLGFNVWYHLALAQYLSGDFSVAEQSWRRCLEHCNGRDDNLVAVRYWLHLTLARLGRTSDAAEALADVRENMDILENHAYHRLALMLKGERGTDETYAAATPDDPDFAAIGYGVGVRRLLDGDLAGARQCFEAVTATTSWPAFGFIAAERELLAWPLR
jgi:tetratricopeptide (TPR) repeat protein